MQASQTVFAKSFFDRLHLLEESDDIRQHVMLFVRCDNEPSEGDPMRTIAREARERGISTAIVDLNNQGTLDFSETAGKPLSLTQYISRDEIPTGAHTWVRVSSDVSKMAAANGHPAPRLMDALKTIRRNHQLVMIDFPATMNAVLAELPAALTAQVYLIVRHGETRTDRIAQIVSRLEAAGSHPSGIIYTDRKYPVPEWLYTLLFKHGRRVRK